MASDYQVAENAVEQPRGRWPFVILFDGFVVSFHRTRESAEHTANRLRAHSYIPNEKALARWRRQQRRRAKAERMPR